MLIFFTLVKALFLLCQLIMAGHIIYKIKKVQKENIIYFFFLFFLLMKYSSLLKCNPKEQFKSFFSQKLVPSSCLLLPKQLTIIQEKLQKVTICKVSCTLVKLQKIQTRPTSFSLISQTFLAFSASLASCDSWFSNEAEFLFQLQYTPDLVKLGSLTT